jgi:hypothetical protein
LGNWVLGCEAPLAVAGMAPPYWAARLRREAALSVNNSRWRVLNSGFTPLQSLAIMGIG